MAAEEVHEITSKVKDLRVTGEGEKDASKAPSASNITVSKDLPEGSQPNGSQVSGVPSPAS